MTRDGSKPWAIITGDLVRTGGMDAPNFALAGYLARTGRPVEIVAYRVDESLLREPNVRFHRVPKPLNAYALGAPLLGAAGLVRASYATGRGGTAVVNGGNCPFPGVNWVHYVHAAFTPRVAARGWRMVKAAASHTVALRTERAALHAARLVIANSDRTRRDVIERVGIPEHRVRTIYYGVDPERFRPPTPSERAEARADLAWTDDRPRVVFLGALGDRRKGFDTLYQAWRLLCAEPSWDADLAVIGTGAELPSWKERTAADGMSSRISYLGFRNDVFRVLWASDALVAPTRYEAYGAGVHEALCTGLAALVSADAGVAERYPDSLHGLLLEDPEDPAALASSLRLWRAGWPNEQPEISRLSTALRARDWDSMARDIVSISEAL
jgi:glycosyltransferase involved in cell wall biosynthesis